MAKIFGSLFFLTFVLILSLYQHGLLACAFQVAGLANSDIRPFGNLTPQSDVQKMANLMLDHLPRKKSSLQMVIPAFLQFNPNQSEQFGDGQKNANANFGPLGAAAFVAILDREIEKPGWGELIIQLQKVLPGAEMISELEISIDGKRENIPVNENSVASMLINLNELGWNSLHQAKWIFFKPKGWGDWFAVSFPQAYSPIDEMLAKIHSTQRQLPDGKSIVDPLGLAQSSEGFSTALRRELEDDLGFELARTERTQRVHGHIQNQDGSSTLTSTGGVWVRYRIGSPYKIIYLVKDPRVLDLEEEEAVVSGTGPHYIGATAEIILNSIGTEPLMTLYGIGSPPASALPDGQLAWAITHQWMGKWLQPGEAFVAPQGTYHWHLNHLSSEVAAQVITPPQVPSTQNIWGFAKAAP